MLFLCFADFCISHLVFQLKSPGSGISDVHPTRFSARSESEDGKLKFWRIRLIQLQLSRSHWPQHRPGHPGHWACARGLLMSTSTPAVPIACCFKRVNPWRWEPAAWAPLPPAPISLALLCFPLPFQAGFQASEWYEKFRGGGGSGRVRRRGEKCESREHKHWICCCPSSVPVSHLRPDLCPPRPACEAHGVQAQGTSGWTGPVPAWPPVPFAGLFLKRRGYFSERARAPGRGKFKRGGRRWQQGVPLWDLQAVFHAVWHADQAHEASHRGQAVHLSGLWPG